MKREDIHVPVEEDEIVIQGERRQDRSNNQGGYYRSERSYGVFYRTIPLPEGTNAESANAAFHDGVLEIDASRQQQRVRTLEIRDATSRTPSVGAPGMGGSEASSSDKSRSKT